MSVPMDHTGFHHEAFLYGDVDEYLAGAIPFLRRGLEGDEAALVAVGRARTEALKGELDGGGRIRFLDMERVGRNPARIIPLWRRFVDEHSGRRPVRGIGEPVWARRSPAEIDECRRHESLLNYAFRDGPAWRLLCPYDSAALDDEVLEAVHGSHSVVSGSASSGAVAREALDSASPFAGVLPARPADARTFAFRRSVLHEARALVAAEAGRAGLSLDGVFDLVAAVGELTANSVVHGGGQGLLCLWIEDGALVVEVSDSGLIRNPLTGRLRPAPAQPGGRGLWMVNHLCDLVQVRSGEEGTTVRVRMMLP